MHQLPLLLIRHLLEVAVALYLNRYLWLRHLVNHRFLQFEVFAKVNQYERKYLDPLKIQFNIIEVVNRIVDSDSDDSMLTKDDSKVANVVNQVNDSRRSKRKVKSVYKYIINPLRI